MRRLSQMFVPRLETLDNRWCPSCTITVDDGTLTITGDDEANTLTVTHDGAGTVTVVCDGGETVTEEDIERIVIDTGDGDDSLTFDVTAELTEALEVEVDLGAGNDTADLDFMAISDQLQVRANLGEGDDLFDVNLDVELKTGADVGIDVRGREGADTFNLSVNEVREDADLKAQFRGGQDDDALNVFLGDPIDAGAEVKIQGNGGAGNDDLTVDATTFGTGANIGEDAELQIRLNGGDGEDTLGTTFEGDVDGTLHVTLDGGDDDDTASAEITVLSGSEGEVHARVNGDDGDDDLTLMLNDDSDDSATVHGRIDGGKGTDSCESTDNVVEKRCED